MAETYLRYHCVHEAPYEKYGQISDKTYTSEARVTLWRETCSVEELLRKAEGDFFTGRNWTEGERNHRIEITGLVKKGLVDEFVIPIEKRVIYLPPVAGEASA